jgi:glutamine amidotransferase-like uncharacterized protein
MNGGFRAWLIMAAGWLVACSPPAGRDADASADILLFTGEGTSAGDVDAWKQVLQANRLHHSTADSAQLDRMSVAEMRAYRLIIMPGGNFERMGNGLEARTSIALREAVRGGTNYLGICAGAFFAGASPYNGLDLFEGRRFEFHALSRAGVRKAVVAVSMPRDVEVQHYWEDGPELSAWGAIIAKYSDGTPAAVQGAVGQGWVVLAGTHPEAPENWRDGMQFHSSARVGQEYAGRLLMAAYEGRALPQFGRATPNPTVDGAGGEPGIPRT